MKRHYTRIARNDRRLLTPWEVWLGNFLICTHETRKRSRRCADKLEAEIERLSAEKR